MQFGVCGGPDLAAVAAGAGFDYFEWQVAGLLKPREDETAFRAALADAQAAPLPCPAVNCFIPGDLKIVGPAVDMEGLRDYVTTVFDRARKARVSTVVFGSGGARRIPDGFEADKAREQVVAFCAMLAPIAGYRGVTVVLEPLNRDECNIMTTVGECAAIARDVDHPNVRLLVDGFHHLKDGDSLEDIVSNGDLLRHVHVATVPGRRPPGAEPCDLGPFFDALKRAGYDGRVSFEGRLSDPAAELPRALEVMKGR